MSPAVLGLMDAGLTKRMNEESRATGKRSLRMSAAKEAVAAIVLLCSSRSDYVRELLIFSAGLHL